MLARELHQQLLAVADAGIAEHSQRFFKSGPGEYGEGDQFLGIRVPVLRQQARRFRELPLEELQLNLHSPWHEERLCALIILTLQIHRAGEESQDQIVRFYLDNTRHINNWDLVDSSAHKIIGPWLMKRDRALLYQLAESDNLWERRIAMLSTLHFIKAGQLEDTLALSKKLMNDPQDLIHKATGWMLREVGKQDLAALEQFLDDYCGIMPRTMLRYAIEKLPPERRAYYMKGGPAS